jgi:hypothetical protein
MRFTVNSNGEVITGTLGEDNFAIMFTKDTFDSLMALQEKYDSAITMADAKTLVEEAKKIVAEVKTEMDATTNPYLLFDKKVNKYFLKYNNIVSKIPLPQVLVDRVLQAQDKGLDYNPVIKMMARLLRNRKVLRGDVSFMERFANYVNIKVMNPELRDKLMEEKGFSSEVASEMAKMYSIQITKEGMLLCYKVSKEITKRWEFDKDGKAVQVDMYPKTKHIDPISGLITFDEPEMPSAEERLFEPPVMGQGGDAFYVVDTNFDGDFTNLKAAHIIQVGKIITHDTWDKVNCNDNQSCVAGLHVGGIDYIRGYQGMDTQTHNIIVDPMDIGAICDDHTGAMRVLRYFVKDVFKGVNNSIFNNSSYASFTDREFKNFLEDSIKKSNEAYEKWKKDKEEGETYLTGLAG